MGSSGGLENLGDDLLLLDQEGADDAVAHAVGASRTSVGSVDRLESLGHARPRSGSGWRDAAQLDVAAGLSAHWKRADLLRIVVH